MRVFIVQEDPAYGGRHIERVFLSKDRADRYVKLKFEPYDWEIVTMEVTDDET